MRRMRISSSTRSLILFWIHTVTAKKVERSLSQSLNLSIIIFSFIHYYTRCSQMNLPRIQEIRIDRNRYSNLNLKFAPSLGDSRRSLMCLYQRSEPNTSCPERRKSFHRRTKTGNVPTSSLSKSSSLVNSFSTCTSNKQKTTKKSTYRPSTTTRQNHHSGVRAMSSRRPLPFHPER